MCPYVDREQYVDSLQRSAKDKEALKDHRSWTSHHHIEVLSEIKKIDPTVRNLLNKLRRKRTKIGHYGGVLLLPASGYSDSN